MRNAMKAVPTKPGMKAVALDTTSQGARRASEEVVSSAASVDPEAAASRRLSPSSRPRC